MILKDTVIHLSEIVMITFVTTIDKYDHINNANVCSQKVHDCLFLEYTRWYFRNVMYWDNYANFQDALKEKKKTCA